MPRTLSTAVRVMTRVRGVVGNDRIILAVLSLVVGAVGGGGVIVFREVFVLLQGLFYGPESGYLFIRAGWLSWWHLLLVPTLGGAAVGLFVCRVMPGERPQGVADVIEASALRGGRMSAKAGLGAAVINATSIGVGASVGREGPAVHLGAAFAGWLAGRLHLTRSVSCTLLGCGVAAAVAASFNAPIAGALFANEVVIGHYALRAFAPIVIASVTGTAISRAYFGDFPAFIIPGHAITSLWEFPAFVALGIIAGVAALVFMHSISLAEKGARSLPVPAWLRPAVGGLMVGVLAMAFPHVLGVGYGTTNAALAGTFSLWLLIAVGMAKIAATAVSIGFGFGGGVFSPSIVIGAVTGGAFGIVATQMFPELSSGADAYSVIGMGAVAAAMLGAPISTTLIIFEMTSDYQLTMAVMIAVVVASLITQHFHGRSFFTWQLERRGLDLQGGFEATLLRSGSVGEVMSRDSELVPVELGLTELRIRLQRSALGKLFVGRDDDRLFGTITLADLSEVAFDRQFDTLITASDVARMHPPVLAVDETLEDAFKLMRDTGEEHIAVVEDLDGMRFLGCVHERDVMAAYNRALLRARREEHGD